MTDMTGMARMTRMLRMIRYACFWVGGGGLVAPISASQRLRMPYQRTQAHA